MPFISGSLSSKYIDELISLKKIKDFPMFICTALGSSFNTGRYSKTVKKVYSKPLEKPSVNEILKMCNIISQI